MNTLSEFLKDRKDLSEALRYGILPEHEVHREVIRRILIIEERLRALENAQENHS